MTAYCQLKLLLRVDSFFGAQHHSSQLDPGREEHALELPRQPSCAVRPCATVTSVTCSAASCSAHASLARLFPTGYPRCKADLTNRFNLIRSAFRGQLQRNLHSNPSTVTPTTEYRIVHTRSGISQLWGVNVDWNPAALGFGSGHSHAHFIMNLIIRVLIAL